MTTITAPNGFSGTTDIGPHRLEFKDGTAEFPGDIPDGVRLYFASVGYGVDGDTPAAPEEPAETVDPRDVLLVEDAPLRDAAVDPQPGDYLPPVNAGQDNPHGPRVVAPGIHGANMPKPIHPGPVGKSGNLDTPDTADDPNVVKDTDTQAANESRLAAAVLIDGQPVQDATAAAAKIDPVNTDQRDVDGPFDPAQHTVAEVNDYLGRGDVGDAERQRVLDAERGGKNRATVAGNTTE